MIGSVKARGRVIGLLALAMAAVLVLSALDASDADARKRKKINVVQCADVGFDCVGTDHRDRLVGTDSNESLRSFGGSDILKGNGGDDTLQGGTGGDTYAGYVGEFGSDFIFDIGGDSDLLDLSSFRSEDFLILSVVGDTDLFLFGPGDNKIEIDSQFGTRRIEKIKFANKTLSGKQIEVQAREVTPEEQAALQAERLSQAESPTQEEKE